MGREIHRAHSDSPSPGLSQCAIGLTDQSLTWKKIMKVVLFCGGLGLRMREYSEAVGRPLSLGHPRTKLEETRKMNQ
jgi:glucose-1-phosphate cytidylyltransferase